MVTGRPEYWSPKRRPLLWNGWLICFGGKEYVKRQWRICWKLCFLLTPCRGYIESAKYTACHTPCGGGFEYLHRGPASRRGRQKGNPVPGPTLLPGDINTGTLPSRLGKSRTWDSKMSSWVQQLHRPGDESTAKGTHIGENNTTPTPKNYVITPIHPCRRKDCSNKSFGRVDDTHKKNGL
jgi:hypothetical protein